MSNPIIKNVPRLKGIPMSNPKILNLPLVKGIPVANPEQPNSEKTGEERRRLSTGV